MIPKAIGSLIQIPNDVDSRREVEARGFWPQTVTPQYCIMRRDYSDGVLKTSLPRPAVICSSFAVTAQDGGAKAL
jgi:hypothetical protein